MSEKPTYEELLQEIDSLREIVNENNCLKSVYHFTSDPIIILDPEQKILSVNPATEKVSGLLSENLVGKKCYEVFHGPNATSPPASCPFYRIRPYGKSDPVIQEEEILGENFLVSLLPVRDTNNRLKKVIHASTDLCKHKELTTSFHRFQIELRECEQKFQDLFKNNHTVILISDPKTGEIIDANPAAEKFYGWTIEELKSLNMSQINIATEKDVKEPPSPTKEIRRYSNDSLHVLASGKVRKVEVFSGPIRIKNKQYLYCIIYDVTKSKQAEKMLRESETKFRTVFNQSYQFMCLLTVSGQVMRVNQAALDFAKVEENEIIGKFFWETPWWEHSKDEQNKLQKAIERAAQGEYISYEAINMNSDGDMVILDFCINPIRDSNGNIIYLCPEAKNINNRKKDEKERKKLEKQLYQAQKMEVIGTLAGGIAHDFNNIIGAIIGFAELALEDIKEGDPARYSVAQISQAGFRAKELVKQILLFSRQSEYEIKPVKIIPLAKEVIKLVRSTLSKKIFVHSKFALKTDVVMADATQLHQIFMNLITNAAHAMNKSGGKLSIELSQIDSDINSLRENHNLSPGKYMKLQVKDTGHGIHKKNLDKIFDPFFSTKSRREGTGLGLSVVHGIVKNHGGDISVTSELGKGTTFSVFLPLVESDEIVDIERINEVPYGTERLLLIDDELPLVEYGKQMLQRLGYQVTSISDSLVAWNEIKKDPKQFDMIITDYEMPNMNGLELSRKINSLGLNIPIIMCTGFSEQIKLEKFEKLGIRFLLLKPVIKQDIAETIRYIFDHAGKRKR